MTPITQLERELADIDRALAVARRTKADLEDKRERKAKELEAALLQEKNNGQPIDPIHS